MSIVAHQYNILSEQLRKGIGGLNQQKVQASESQLKMEALKYGIRKDERAAGLAERGMVEREAAGRRAQEQHDQTANQRQLKEKESKVDLDRMIELQNTPFTFENFNKAINHDGTMSEDGVRKAFEGIQRDDDPQSMYGIQENVGSWMHIVGAADPEHRQNKLNQLKGHMEDYEKMNSHEQDMPHVQDKKEQTEQAISLLEDAIQDPIGAKKKQIAALNRMYGQLRDADEQAKGKFLIQQHVDELEAMQKSEAALLDKTRVVKVHQTDPITGKKKSEEVLTGSKTPHTPREGWFLTPQEGGMKVIDVGNAPKLQKTLLAAQKSHAWVQKYGDMTEEEYKAYKSQVNPRTKKNYTDAEISSLADFTGQGEILESLNKQINTIKQAQVLNKQGYDNDIIRQMMDKNNMTYEEVINALSITTTAAP